MESSARTLKNVVSSNNINYEHAYFLSMRVCSHNVVILEDSLKSQLP